MRSLPLRNNIKNKVRKRKRPSEGFDDKNEGKYHEVHRSANITDATHNNLDQLEKKLNQLSMEIEGNISAWNSLSLETRTQWSFLYKMTTQLQKI